MSFHSGKKPCRVLYYLYHNHKVGFNLRSGMPLGWPSGKLGGWSRDHFTLKKTQWELKGIISPETVLRTHWIGRRYLILANSLELQNWFLFSFFSFLFFSSSKIPGADWGWECEGLFYMNEILGVDPGKFIMDFSHSSQKNGTPELHETGGKVGKCASLFL